jgi:hypothetical protein
MHQTTIENMNGKTKITSTFEKRPTEEIPRELLDVASKINVCQD